MKASQETATQNIRFTLIIGVLIAALLVLVFRGLDLQVLNKDFLQGEGEARHLRVVSIPAHRGMIVDRHGEPLAVSTPVDSVWVNPKDFFTARDQWPKMAAVLGMSKAQLRKLVEERSEREFVYIKRHVNPELAAQVMALSIPGVSLQREYHRYYPGGEVAAHVVGFTNVDDVGQEGLELAYNDWLRGEPGGKRVIKDRLGHIVEDVERISSPRPGNELALSIDRRIQYLAYRELKAVVQENNARSGSAVVLDARTAEVLAMVNQPAYNPNNRGDLRGSHYRNRAVTDVFEPGSTIKPFTVAAGLESGLYRPDTIVDTTPGYYRVGGHSVKDIRNYGRIDVATVIKKSSNVGASKIALSMLPERLWETFARVGFGAPTGSGYPGESGGFLSDYNGWGELERATLSFGYGLSVTPLQLAHAYTVLAGDGRLRPVSFVRTNQVAANEHASAPVFREKTLRQIRDMMAAVVEPGGTGRRAKVPGYRIAGKTGTVKKSIAGGYAEDRYLALFAGMAPATDPRLVMVVMIDEPNNGVYYGGQVAAPVFARVMAGALRLLDVPPDDLPSLGHQVAMVGGHP